VAEKKSEPIKIEIQLDEETAQGVYANLAVVNHTDAEFILDFIFAQPQVPRAKVRSRVITSPRHVKRLIAVLQENLQRFERVHGPVPADAVTKIDDANYH
jgi:hypothetical protein